MSDAISREYAIRIVDNIDTWQAGWRGDAIESLKALPSAQPQHTGKWIDSHGYTTIDGHDMSELFIRCSECGHDYPDLKDMRFCPNCGAKME